jgi:hypothetical protein
VNTVTNLRVLQNVGGGGGALEQLHNWRLIKRDSAQRFPPPYRSHSGRQQQQTRGR